MIMNDLEQPMLSYYVIYFEKFRKIMQRTEKEALMEIHEKANQTLPINFLFFFSSLLKKIENVNK